jgi:Ca-activated chloride channel family protein
MNFSNPHFGAPEWLWLAFLGPLALWALQRYSARARRRQLARIAAPAILARLTASHSPMRRLIKEALLLLSVAGIGLALARPQWGEESVSGTLLGRDTVFIFDCSRSMLAADISPTRMDRAKLAVLDYVQNLGRGRVGLIAFAGQAFLQCPLTYDYNAFRDALLALDERTIPVAGTDIGRSLDEAFRAMDKSVREKVVVLLTDGEDLEKGGVKTAEKMAQEGLVVFTVGVGTAAGAEIQILNEQGRPELLRDPKGEIVRSSLDETTLREIARVTHGAYYPLGPMGEGLAKVRLASENLHSSASGGPGRKFGVDRFHFIVAGVLALLVAESLTGTRKGAKT